MPNTDPLAFGIRRRPHPHAPGDANILRAARGMIEQHGERAEWRAEQRAAESERQGRLDMVAVWGSIAEAIRALRRFGP